ncbi:MAG TPA: DNA-3-methyladenine glycosylase [Rudaea sp.]|jgi:AraC family transcriptional regulator of adaptative response / DNA-3-methyladenine glycosylase II|nr:DNA-3-methyladenine glycosylase [Rudaea sp.]
MPRKPTRKTYRLRYQPPYDFAALLTFLGKRAIPSVERVNEKGYERDFALHGKVGRVRVEQGAGDALKLVIDFPDVARHADIAAHVRRVFDTDADIATINQFLSKHRHLKKCIRANPGQRLPGGWDVFEFAIRAVLGQQISVAAARTLAQRIVERYGKSVVDVDGKRINLFPEPDAIADVDLTSIGLTRARAATLNTISRAVRDGVVSVDRDQPLDDFVTSWTQLPGIGDWTAQYIAMRALSNPNAFPAADLVLRRAVARDGKPVPLRELHAIAAAWQPWRAYAVLHLWRASTP